LGVIGKEHLCQAFDNVDTFKYKRLAGYDERNLPYVVEAAFAEVADSGRLVVTGVNFSPAIANPVVRFLEWLLSDQKVSRESNTCFVLHIATVAPTYLDR